MNSNFAMKKEYLLYVDVLNENSNIPTDDNENDDALVENNEVSFEAIQLNDDSFAAEKNHDFFFNNHEDISEISTNNTELRIGSPRENSILVDIPLSYSSHSFCFICKLPSGLYL